MNTIVKLKKATLGFLETPPRLAYKIFVSNDETDLSVELEQINPGSAGYLLALLVMWTRVGEPTTVSQMIVVMLISFALGVVVTSLFGVQGKELLELPQSKTIESALRSVIMRGLLFLQFFLWAVFAIYAVVLLLLAVVVGWLTTPF